MRGEKIFFDGKDGIYLRNISEITAVYKIKGKSQFFPMREYRRNIFRKVAESIPFKAARMRGEEGSGCDSACGDYGERYREGAFSYTRDVVNGENAHKKWTSLKKLYETIINFLLFFVKRIKIEK